MTDDEIIKLAIEAGDDWGHTVEPDKAFLLRFARLVAAAESERCAMITGAPHWKIAVRNECAKRAAEIRARGEK